ncbi:NADH-quinone oxidoreductase subunit C [Alienimonas californiensis]|uniref:NAD(P)H-quinone oxidoreductase subunit J n=1 Tax=Alienimonas californiensis TaxID=2527989 RepID=A0A517PEJ7_9PLAN|nr:NADH-quinone oxidoreductase subunit C [Alienimonas californiensis]QDT17788.1 NAD(P)H-quinone oxidoreductase subunit J [Alienimonas californiensis]
MTAADLHTALRDRFGDAVRDLRAATDPWIEIAADAVPDVLTHLRDEHGLRHLNDLTAYDFAPRAGEEGKYQGEPRLEVVYRLSNFPLTQAHTLKVVLPRGTNDDLPEVPSASGIFPIAEWHERETFDLLGVNFTGHPNLCRILTSDDWVGHPLRKDYEMPEEYGGIRCR